MALLEYIKTAYQTRSYLRFKYIKLVAECRKKIRLGQVLVKNRILAKKIC